MLALSHDRSEWKTNWKLEANQLSWFLGEMASATPETRLRTRVFALVTILVSLAGLGWALHGVSWTELGEEIRELDWRWIAVGALADLVVYVIQGWRWSLLLRPLGPVSVWSATRAIFVGLFANEVLPLRAGELIRCFVQGRWTEIPFSVTLASALVILGFLGRSPAPAVDASDTEPMLSRAKELVDN